MEGVHPPQHTLTGDDDQTPLNPHGLQHLSSRPISNIQYTGTKVSSPAEIGKVSVAQWGIHWYRPASILCLFIIGFGSALGHHLFYQKLDGTRAEHQQWTSRIGTSLAYLFKFSLAAMVGISRDQWLWLTLQTQFLTLAGIDAIFGASSNLLCIFNGDAIQKAKILTIMALVKWLFPLSTIFTPGTISVIPGNITTEFNCTVPSLDFNYNTTTAVERLGGANHNLGPRYGGPNAAAIIVYTVPFYLGQATPIRDTKPFGPKWNVSCATECSYTTQFRGPSVTCAEVDFNMPNAPWSTYRFSECLSPSKGDPTITIPNSHVALWNNSPNSFWVLKSEKGLPDSRVACREKHVYTCKASTADYSIKQIIRENQFLEPEIVANDLGPIPNNRIIGNKWANEANWVHFDMLFGLIRGVSTVSVKSSGTESAEMGWGWDNTKIMVVNYSSDIGKDIENVAHKMAVSVVHVRGLFYSINTVGTCLSTEVYNIYKYESSILKITYAAALGISAFLAALGIVALRRNGLASDTSFSTIVRTTRNPTLDRRLAGGCLASAPLPKKFENLKLRFGEVSAYATDYDGGEVRHVAMGVKDEDEVLPIRKGGRYS